MVLLVVVVAAIWLAIIYVFSSGGGVMFEDWDSPSEPGAGGRPVTYASLSSDPAWSPDGASIAYISTTEDSDFTGFPHLKSSVCLMDAQGQSKRRLLSLQENGAFSEEIISLDWLSNGQLVYERWTELVAFSLNGVRRPLRDWGSSSALSPDGSQIAYVLADGIHIALLDGSDSRFIAAGDQPAWSRDGSRLAYVSTAESAIYTVNVDGTGLARVASGDLGLDWSPDGTRIAFIRTWSPGIVAVNVDGSSEVQLTTGDDSDPDWSPDSTKIAFERADNIYVQTLGEPEAKRLTTGYGPCGSAN